MKRKIYDKLIEWKEKRNNMPLMLIGARQVGKTYILEEFCKQNFKEYIYINLERENNIKDIFENTIEPETVINRILLEKELSVDPEETVFFFDEIQVSERAIVSLKYFNESDTNYNIVCAGSLLGVALNRFKSSYPVGKVWQLYMYPMDIEEFFLAANYELLSKEIRKCFEKNEGISEGLHKKAIEIYKEYLFVGGMPSSVLEYINKNRMLSNYDRTIKRNILDSYVRDMAKYATNSETIKNAKVYNSLPNQLSNKNNKFKYSAVEKKGDKRTFENSIEWLLSAKLAYKSTRVDFVEIPLKVYENESFFKLFLSDIGLLIEMLDLNPVDLFGDDLKLFSGYYTENYVAQTFVAGEMRLNYWESGNSAEIDFLTTIKGNVIPIEVKASTNTRSKSLRNYVEKYKPKYAIRISGKNFGMENNIKSVPLYAAHLIKELNY